MSGEILVAALKHDGKVGEFVKITGRAVSFYAFCQKGPIRGWMKTVKDDLTGKKKMIEYDKNTVPHVACLLLLAGF